MATEAVAARPAGPWTPRVTLSMAVLSAAAFVYVTAEIMPVGALPVIAADLNVSEAVVATLLASYALVAAVVTLPLVRWTATWPRRRTLLVTLVSLTVSQTISALAPNFAVLAGGRVLTAITHGLMWSVIAPIGIRLVPSTHAARATMAVYVGTALALVVGSPLTAALSDRWGWRQAVAAIALAAAAVTVAARLTLPELPAAAPERHWEATTVRHLRNRNLLRMCLLTLVGVTAHFISYTFIVVVITDVVGISGPNLAWLLAAYGVAGLTAMGLLARPGDRRPRATVVAALAALVAALAGLAMLGWAPWGPWSPLPALVLGVAAILGWGAMATAVPPMLQSAAIRHAPDDPDGASGFYVTAFQVGIMAGSLVGGLLFEQAGVPAMLAVSAALIAGVLAVVLGSRDLLASGK